MPTELELRAPQHWSERAYQKVLSLTLGALGFFLLFSTAGTNIALAVILVLALLSPGRAWRTRFWREPVLAISLLLLAYITLRTLLGEGFNKGSTDVFRHYHELLLLPLLWAMLRNARRPQAFANGLMAGSVLLAALYWIGPLGHPQYADWLLLHRISASFGLAVCSFLLFEHARLGRLPRVLGYTASFALMLTVLFAIDARTGHVVMLLLLACAAFRAAPRRARIAAVVCALTLAVIAGAFSPSVRLRVQETLVDTQASSEGKPVIVSSTAARIQVWHNALAVAREHWLVGTGWQNYTQAVQQVAARRYADPSAVPGALSVNPHNEYVMQLAAGGVPALLLFVLWLAWPVSLAVRDTARGRPWASAVGCVALAFAVAALFNSLLLDFVEAHFYVAVMAWLLVRRVEG